MPSHPDGLHGSHDTGTETAPEFETAAERKARLAKEKQARRVLGVANRQMSKEDILAIVEGRTPIRSANLPPPDTSRGPVPQASTRDTNLFLRQAAAAEGQNIDPALAAFAALDAAQANRAAERAGKKRRRSRAIESALLGGVTAVGRGIKTALFAGAERLGRVGKVRAFPPER